MGNADGEGQDKDDSLVHKSFEVNEYLVKAKPVCLSPVSTRSEQLRDREVVVTTRTRPSVGLYTILSSPVLYGVCHTNGASVAGRILRNGRAIVLH